MTLRKTKILSMILALVSVFTLAFTMVGCSDNVNQDSTSKVEQSTLSASDFKTEFASTRNVRLMAATPMTVAANSAYAEQTLVATVLPATAANKAVDWTVAWADGQSGSVSDYVTVTPTSDGSTTASIKCYKAFTGNIVVTVTTRQNSYQADCIVTFVGVPTDITVDSTVTYSGDAYRLGIGQTYTFDAAANNIFNVVGADYKNLEVSINGVGSVVLGYMEHYNSSGTDKWYDTSDTTVALDTLKDNFITASIANGVITVNTLKSIESYYSSTQRMDGGRTTAYHDKFRSYVDDCYFTLTVTEPVSGISETVKLRFDDTVVTSVTTNDTQIYF